MTMTKFAAALILAIGLIPFALMAFIALVPKHRGNRPPQRTPRRRR